MTYRYVESGLHTEILAALLGTASPKKNKDKFRWRKGLFQRVNNSKFEFEVFLVYYRSLYIIFL